MPKLYETINKDNWCQYTINDGNGRRCLVGHGIELGVWYQERDKVCEAIRLLYPERVRPHSEPVYFNNHRDTTVEDVIRVCKLADV